MRRQKDILIRRSVPLVFTFLLVVGITFACLTVGNDVWHHSIRRMREATLMQDLSIMRQGIDNFTKDREVPPQSFQELVDLKYLREIPTDPLTGKTDWVPHFGTVMLDKGRTTFGIDDVHSRSEHNGW